MSKPETKCVNATTSRDCCISALRLKTKGIYMTTTKYTWQPQNLSDKWTDQVILQRSEIHKADGPPWPSSEAAGCSADSWQCYWHTRHWAIDTTEICFFPSFTPKVLTSLQGDPISISFKGGQRNKNYNFGFQTTEEKVNLTTVRLHVAQRQLTWHDSMSSTNNGWQKIS
jgi:hypothetical protein